MVLRNTFYLYVHVVNLIFVLVRTVTPPPSTGHRRRHRYPPPPAHLPPRGVALRPQARAVAPSLPPRGCLAFCGRGRVTAGSRQLFSPRALVAEGARRRGRGCPGRGGGVEEGGAPVEEPRAFPEQR